MHFSQTMVIVCADDNYSPSRPYSAELGRILSTEHATDRFHISVFGASLEFSQPVYLPGWQKRIETAKKLHISKVVIVDHLLCGAYEEEFGSLSKAEEAEKHLVCLENARAWFKKNAPEFEFVAYLQDRDRSEKVI